MGTEGGATGLAGAGGEVGLGLVGMAGGATGISFDPYMLIIIVSSLFVYSNNSSTNIFIDRINNNRICS